MPASSKAEMYQALIAGTENMWRRMESCYVGINAILFTIELFSIQQFQTYCINCDSI